MVMHLYCMVFWQELKAKCPCQDEAGAAMNERRGEMIMVNEREIGNSGLSQKGLNG